MIGYLLGFIGFMGLFLFDLFSMNHRITLKYISMVLGVLCILIGSILITLTTEGFYLPSMVQILAGVMTILFLLLLVYSVVIEVGMTTYQANNQPSLKTNGTYALSRHPGVLWLFGFYLGLGLMLSNQGLLIAACLFTIINVLYVFFQERWIFPHLFDQYEVYQATTPFIIPSYKSVSTFLNNTNVEENN